MALSTFNSDDYYVDKGWKGVDLNNYTGSYRTYLQRLINGQDKWWEGDKDAYWLYANSNADEAFRNYLNQQATANRNAAVNAGKKVLSQSEYDKFLGDLRNQDTAARQAAQEAQEVAGKSTASNINAGINKSRAGLLGDAASAASQTNGNTQQQAYGTAKAQNASTQADYLARLGEVEGMENSASNMANSANAAAWSAGLSGAVSGAMTGAFLGSDERIKEYDNHSDLPKADVDDALRRIESIEYKYKDDTGLDKEDHVGVTAQSVEHTAFDDMVSEGPEGYKQLDKQMMLEAVLAGIASLRKELDVLEGNE